MLTVNSVNSVFHYTCMPALSNLTIFEACFKCTMCNSLYIFFILTVNFNWEEQSGLEYYFTGARNWWTECNRDVKQLSKTVLIQLHTWTVKGKKLIVECCPMFLGWLLISPKDNKNSLRGCSVTAIIVITWVHYFFPLTSLNASSQAAPEISVEMASSQSCMDTETPNELLLLLMITNSCFCVNNWLWRTGPATWLLPRSVAVRSAFLKEGKQLPNHKINSKDSQETLTNTILLYITKLIQSSNF